MNPSATPTALFRAEGTTADPSHPALLGGRCRACGKVFFPPQRYGCEACGSTDLEDHAIAGKGRLVARAKVHLHADPARPAPFTVGAIVTEEGAVLRALLDPASADALQPGDAVATLLVPETRDPREPHEGYGTHDIRFGKAA